MSLHAPHITLVRLEKLPKRTLAKIIQNQERWMAAMAKANEEMSWRGPQQQYHFTRSATFNDAVWQLQEQVGNEGGH